MPTERSAVSVACTRLLALVYLGLLAAPVARVEAQELFRLPKIRSVAEEPPPGCDRARKRAAEILVEIDKEIPPAMKAIVREAAADLEPGQTPAEGWDQAAALAALNADPPTALWAELQALQLQWDDAFATNAGIYLYYLDKHDDAKLFLHCAHDMGSRSPFLLEALANAYRETADKEQAKIFIGEAEAAAPADPIIKTEKALTETGRPPAPPPPLAGDPLERAFAELERHHQYVLAAIKQASDLQNRVDAAGGVREAAIDKEKMRRELLDQLRAGYQSGRDSVRALMSQGKRFTGDARRLSRNSIASTLITLYLSATENLFTMTGSAENPWSTSNTLDLSFWGEVLGFEPARLTRMFRDLMEFEYNGHKAGGTRGRLDDFGAAPFRVYQLQANEDRRQGYRACSQSGSARAQAACELEVDKKYCAALRELFQDYVDESERWFQRAALRFDNGAARRLAGGGAQVEDAFVYASTCAKEMRIAPGDTSGQDQLKAQRASYLRLVDLAVGGGERKGGIGGPGYQVQRAADTYRREKQTAESTHEGLRLSIAATCEPVDRKVLEQLLEEQRKAIQSTLLERLRRDFEAEWEPTMSCTLKAGSWFQAGIDDTGKISLGGKWKWLNKKFPDANHLPDEVEVARSYKFNFKDGKFVGVSAGVEGSAKYGPFTGKGSTTMGVAWNSKRNQWDYPVELGGTLGIGFTTKGGYGATCYPGKARVKFEARAVAKDALEYVRSLDPE